MEITWYGQAFFKLKGKTTTLIIDPYYPDFVGLKLPKDLSADIALKTHDHQDHSNLDAVTGGPVKITGPGEYEVKGVLISGVDSFHDNVEGQERGKNTIYHMAIDGINVVHLGDLGHALTQEQIEEINTTDILLIPVGGVFTIDAKVASEVVSQLEPSIIIPMHFSVPGLKFQLGELSAFTKEMGVEHPEPIPKLVITKDKLPEEPQVIVLSNC